MGRPPEPPSRRSGRRRHWLLLIVLVAVAIEAISLVGLAVVERSWSPIAALRARRAGVVADPAGPAQGERLVAVVHPFLGYVLDATHPYRVHEIDYPVSEHGFADAAPPFHRRAPDRLIVAITGGSVAFQISTDGLETLRQGLAAAPAFAGKEIVFVRLAMGGVKQPQQLMTLQYLLALGAEFDVVINVDGFNEVATSEHDHAGKVFYAFPAPWIQLAGGFSDPATGLLLGKIALYRNLRQRWARALSAPGVSRLASVNSIWALGDRFVESKVELAREAIQVRKAANAGAGELPYQVTGPRLGPGSAAATDAELVALWRRSSEEMAVISRAAGIRYFHFLQPNQYAPVSKPMGEAERALAIQPDHPYSAAAIRGYPLLIREGRKLLDAGVRYRDLTDLFVATEEPIYRDSCCHFNEEGCRRLAAAIAEAVVDSGVEGP